jgi:hypothetical protein
MVHATGFTDVAAYSALANNTPERKSSCYWIMGRKPQDPATPAGG